MGADASRDWSTSGLTIRQAMVEASYEEDQQERPRRIKWGNHLVVTGDVLAVPRTGFVRLEFIANRPGLRQGADLAVPGGMINAGGSSVTLLRTWLEEELPNVVEYPYESRDGRLLTCNVYEVPGSKTTNDWRWGDYAGMWVEELTVLDRVYHCSHASSSAPDFQDLVYRVTVK